MGMRIPSSGGTQSTGGANAWQQQRQVFSQLSQSLQSGDLASAQKAYSSLTANASRAPDPNSPLGKLGQALQSGDIAAAQQAFSAMRSSGHHHHQASAPQVSPAPSAALNTSGSVGTQINTVA